MNNLSVGIVNEIEMLSSGFVEGKSVIITLLAFNLCLHNGDTQIIPDLNSILLEVSYELKLK